MNGYGSPLVYGGDPTLDEALHAHRAGVGTGSADRVCKSFPPGTRTYFRGVLGVPLYLTYLLAVFSLFVVAGE